jgi:hypothetical protein
VPLLTVKSVMGPHVRAVPVEHRASCAGALRGRTPKRSSMSCPSRLSYSSAAAATMPFNSRCCSNMLTDGAVLTAIHIKQLMLHL